MDERKRKAEIEKHCAFVKVLKAPSFFLATIDSAASFFCATNEEREDQARKFLVETGFGGNFQNFCDLDTMVRVCVRFVSEMANYYMRKATDEWTANQGTSTLEAVFSPIYAKTNTHINCSTRPSHYVRKLIPGLVAYKVDLTLRQLPLMLDDRALAQFMKEGMDGLTWGNLISQARESARLSYCWSLACE